MSGILNLKKNDVLNLTKEAPGLKHVMLAAGWDVVKKGFFSFSTHDYDLDLVAILTDESGKMLGEEGLIYFGNLNGEGIKLHGDNLTGEGDGDDEMISVDLDRLPQRCKNVVFAVTIYQAKERRQSFSNVKNAYVRLLNEDENDREICRYNLSESGGNNTAIIFAELEKVNGSWQFTAKGQFLNASVSSLANMYR